MIKNSTIYNGKVIHRRFKPKEHYFKYNVFSLLIDIDELEIIENKLVINFSEKFLFRRGRVNCSLNDQDGWKWLGIQFTIKLD